MKRIMLAALLITSVANAQEKDQPFGKAFCASLKDKKATLFSLDEKGKPKTDKDASLRWIVCKDGKVKADLGTPGRLGPSPAAIEGAMK